VSCRSISTLRLRPRSAVAGQLHCHIRSDEPRKYVEDAANERFDRRRNLCLAMGADACRNVIGANASSPSTCNSFNAGCACSVHASARARRAARPASPIELRKASVTRVYER